MRPLFAILVLLLCLIATRADDPLVIKDTEAARYVGKKVEVRGLVVSVITSPLGTTFINFGREYPNQIFAGFIPMGSKRGTVWWASTLSSTKREGPGGGDKERRPESGFPIRHFLTRLSFWMETVNRCSLSKP
jgi:hypothetical protein